MAVQSTNAPVSIVPLMKWFGAWREQAKRRRDYRRTVGVLSGLSDRELADVGVLRNDLRHVAKKAVWG